MSPEHVLTTLAGIGVISVLCQWFAWWVKLPAILFLLLAGIVAGPVTGWLHPDALFGDLLFPIVSLGVAVILFEGSLTLNFNEITGLEKVVRRFVTSGVLSTWAIVSVSTYLLLDFSVQLSLLFGAVMVVTGPTVVVPMLRTVRPNARVANILRWEGIVIDPIGALLAVLVFEFIASGQGQGALEHTVLTFALVVATGIITGVATGYALGLILRQHLLPEYLHNVATLGAVCGLFALANGIQEESGLLAVTAMGMSLANMKDVDTRDILDFKESLSVLFISVLFVLLAARVEFRHFQQLGIAAVGVFLVIQFVARPAKVLLSTYGAPLSWQEKALLSWIAPRGIIAAAVTALFALRLEEQNVADAQLLVPLAFAIIIGTVVLQSATAGALARWLGVAEPEPKGMLIIGANKVARVIAKGLMDAEFRVLLADMNWENIRNARMEGMPVYFGNPVSEHADRQLDLVGIGRVLALSPQRELNSLACMRYKLEFGKDAVFELPVSLEQESQEKRKISHHYRGRIAFGANASYSKLSSMVSQHAKLHTTTLSDDFTYEQYLERYRKLALPLFAIDTRHRLHVYTEGAEFKPGKNWNILTLVVPEETE